MKKLYAAAVAMVCALTGSAFAEIIPVPNGSFEADGQIFGNFTQSFTSWTVSFSSDNVSTPSGPTSQQSGIFSTFSNYTATDGSTFAGIFNLGSGTVSFSSTSVFLFAQRDLTFDFAFLSNDTIGGGNDQFRVVVDFFTDATESVSTGSVTTIVNAQSNFAGITGSAPFNPTNATFADLSPTNYQTLTIQMPQFYLNYARITFIIDNSGPAQGTGNGLGVTGLFLDNVVLTPEPSTIALFGLGLLGLGAVALRRRKKLLPPPAA